MTSKNTTNSVTMWQNCYEGDGVAESALVITSYLGNVIGINQNGAEVLINTASVNEFIKNIKEQAKKSESL